jgi:dipeptidyl aminopeptidase/acylaminoacyl peptidase
MFTSSRLHRLLAAFVVALGAPAAVAQAPAAPAPAFAPALIPVEAFGDLPFLSDPTLSPDGRQIAARIFVGGHERIGIWNATGERQAPRVIAVGDFQLRWVRWAGDNRLLVSVQTTVTIYGMSVPVSRVLSYDLETRRNIVLGDVNGLLGDDVIFVDPAGRYILLSAQEQVTTYPSVQRIDLETGTATEVQRARSGVWRWFADENGVVRAGVDYRERALRLYYRSAAGQELRRIAARRYTNDESVIDTIRFLSNADRGIVVTDSETGRFAVYEYDFATDTRGPPLYQNDEVDVGSTIIGRDGTLDGVVYEDDRRRVHWLDPDMRRLQERIDRTFAGKTNIILGSSRDANRVLIWSGGADDPGTYYVFDRAARRMEAFASPHEQLFGRAFAPVRPVRYTSRDGLAINGYLTLPPGRAERGLPLIVMPHGGPFARDSWDFDAEVQFLASRGYAVLQPNFRGSTGYGRAFVERGYGQFGTGMIDDIDDGVEWLTGQGIVDRARVCIMGASYGGYAALWAPIRSPERYRCAISLAGVTDIRAMLRYDSRMMAAPRYAREWRRRVEGEERTDLAAISPLQQAARLRVPLLIAHGERDTNVPPSQSRQLVAALRRAGAANVESVFYPKAEHGFTEPADSIDYLRRVEAFLARHNPA